MPLRPRITFLLPVTGDAHHRLRTDALEQIGGVRVLAFVRRNHHGRTDGARVESLGRIGMGDFGGRLRPYLGALRRIRAAAADTDVFYVFGLDLAVLCLLAGLGLRRRPRLIQEVPDIHASLTRTGAASRLLRGLDRWVAGRLDLLVVTSPDYLDGYYTGMLNRRPLRTLVVENRVGPGAAARRDDPAAPEGDRPLKLGYFGVLRCRRSLQILTEALRRAEGRLQLVLRGTFLNTGDLRPDLESLPGVAYLGPYLSPDDLPAMYGGIDVLWACYPYMGSAAGNWRWARTKRYYEGARYGRPMIVARGTRDAARALDGRFGIEIDLADMAGAVRTICGLTHDRVRDLTAAARALPREAHTEITDYAELKQAVVAVARGTHDPVV